MRSLPICLAAQSSVALFVALLAVLVSCGPAAAISRSWNTAVGSGAWSAAGNWSPAGVPAAADNVTISLTDGVARTVDYDYAGPAVSLGTLALDLQGPGADAVTLSIPSGALRATVETIGASGRGAVEQIAGSNLASSALYLGFSPGSSGVYDLSGSASLTVTGIAYVGNSGRGELNLSGGAIASNTDAAVGANVGSMGLVTVDGAGSQWVNSSVPAIGLLGSGSLTVTNGGYVSSTNGRLGRENGATGVALLDGAGSRWQLTGDLSVGGLAGRTGVGTLTIQNEATVSVGNALDINNLSTVNLNGGTLRFNAASGLNRLNYTAGTVQLAGSRQLGSDAAATAIFGSTPTIPAGKTLAVEGAASFGSSAKPVESVLVSGGALRASTLRVGGDGSGVLQVTAGGSVEQLDAGSSLVISGNALPYTGSVTVSGPGSTLHSPGGIAVGFIVAGGSMTVSNGGVVTSGNSGISGPLGTSTVTVTGPGSLWDLSGASLFVGGSTFGYGTLNIQDGGTVYVGTQLRISPSTDSKLNLAGGTLRFDTIAGTAGLAGINYTSGTVQLAGDRTLGSDDAVTALFGASPTIPAGKGLTVEGTATFASGATLQGGVLSAGEINGAAPLDIVSGTVNVTGPSGLLVGIGPLAGSTILGPSSYLNVASTMQVVFGGRLTSRGGNVAVGAAQIDSGGRWTVVDGVQSVGAGLTNLGSLVLVDTTIDGPVDSPAGSTIDVVGDVTFQSPVSGAGQFYGSGVATFLGGFSPGDSPAIVGFQGDVVLGGANELKIELAGAEAGSGYDRVSVAGGLTLDGVLRVALLGGYEPPIGAAFDVLDWGGVGGAFSSLDLPALAPGRAWDTTELYSSGVLSVVAAGPPGDYNGDGVVNAADYSVWRDALGTGAVLPNDPTPGSVTAADYTVWAANYGATAASGAAAVPEPEALLLASPMALAARRRRKPRRQTNRGDRIRTCDLLLPKQPR